MSETENKYLTELQNKQLLVINHYGVNHQLIKLAEECAELIQAILKDADPFRADIVCEMADVINIINQIRLKDKIMDEGIKAVEKYKVDREINRLRLPLVEAWKLAQD